MFWKKTEANCCHMIIFQIFLGLAFCYFKTQKKGMDFHNIQEPDRNYNPRNEIWREWELHYTIVFFPQLGLSVSENCRANYIQPLINLCTTYQHQWSKISSYCTKVCRHIWVLQGYLFTFSESTSFIFFLGGGELYEFLTNSQVL